MRKIALSTIASYTFFYLLIAPIFILTMLLGLSHSIDNPSLYIKITMSFVLMYIVFVSVPTSLNICWELYKKEKGRPDRFIYSGGFLFILTASCFFGGLSSINTIIGLISLYVANKWVINFKKKTKVILAIIPLFLLIGSSIGFYAWSLI